MFTRTIPDDINRARTTLNELDKNDQNQKEQVLKWESFVNSASAVRTTKQSLIKDNEASLIQLENDDESSKALASLFRYLAILIQNPKIKVGDKTYSDEEARQIVRDGIHHINVMFEKGTGINTFDLDLDARPSKNNEKDFIAMRSLLAALNNEHFPGEAEMELRHRYFLFGEDVEVPVVDKKKILKEEREILKGRILQLDGLLDQMKPSTPHKRVQSRQRNTWLKIAALLGGAGVAFTGGYLGKGIQSSNTIGILEKKIESLQDANNKKVQPPENTFAVSTVTNNTVRFNVPSDYQYGHDFYVYIASDVRQEFTLIPNDQVNNSQYTYDSKIYGTHPVFKISYVDPNSSSVVSPPQTFSVQ